MCQKTSRTLLEKVKFKACNSYFIVYHHPGKDNLLKIFLCLPSLPVNSGFQVMVVTSDNYVKRDSGLIYRDFEVGQGDCPKSGQQVFFSLSLAMPLSLFCPIFHSRHQIHVLKIRHELPLFWFVYCLLASCVAHLHQIPCVLFARLIAPFF